jgi:integrase
LHLTGLEVERLLAAAKDSRNETRDRCLVLITFRHGLRVSEACRLNLDQVDPESRVLRLVEDHRIDAQSSASRDREGGLGLHVRRWAYNLVRMRNLLAQPVGAA